eukprot:g13468.t1
MKFQSFSEATEVGLYCWNPEGGRQKRFKDVTVEDIQRGLQTPTEPPKLQLDRVRCERLEGPHDVRKHEHLTRRTIDSWNVLFAAEIDALDVDGVVEVKSGNPRNFAMKVLFQMISNGSKRLVRADRRQDRLLSIEQKSLERMFLDHSPQELRAAESNILE